MNNNGSARYHAKKAFEAERTRVRAAVAYSLELAGYVVRQQVYVCNYTLDIQVMLPEGKSFFVQAGWQENPGETYIFDKDFLAMMADKCGNTPLYFAVGVGKGSPLLRLDERLLKKFISPDPGGFFELEKLESSSTCKEPESVIVKTFDYLESEVCIWLDRDDHQFRMLPRWGDQEIIGDAELRIHDRSPRFSRMSLNEAKSLDGVVKMADLLQQMVVTGLAENCSSLDKSLSNKV